tara:strand:- start:436 stop:666 length:231 start_codon:yes stop_codon:yes gene_type:complete
VRIGDLVRIANTNDEVVQAVKDMCGILGIVIEVNELKQTQRVGIEDTISSVEVQHEDGIKTVWYDWQLELLSTLGN